MLYVEICVCAEAGTWESNHGVERILSEEGSGGFSGYKVRLYDTTIILEIVDR